MNFDFSVISQILGDISKVAIPIGLIFYLAETLVSLFLRFAFPKRFRGE